MIKIEMSFESGAQAREEMLSLLGADLPCFSGDDDLPSVRTLQEPVGIGEDAARRREATVAEDAEASAVDAPAVDAQSPAEPAKRTRRTKAQIAADEAAAAAFSAGAIAGLVERTTRPGIQAAPEIEAAEPTATAEPETDAGEDPNTPPSAIYAHRAAEYLAANPGTTPLQHMKAELTKVNDKFGLDEVRKLMVDFGIPRIGEVPVEKYPALLAAIDKRLAA